MVKRYKTESDFDGGAGMAEDDRGMYVEYEDYKALEGKLSSESKIVEAYEGAMVALREALGLSGHDEHELVLDEIKRLVGRLSSLTYRFDLYKSFMREVDKQAAEAHLATVVEKQPTNPQPPEYKDGPCKAFTPSGHTWCEVCGWTQLAHVERQPAEMEKQQGYEKNRHWHEGDEPE